MPERALQMKERTLLLIKPDGVERRLVGIILARVERKGYYIEAMRMETIGFDAAEKHYASHRDKPFYDKLVKYIMSGRLVAAVISGEGCIGGIRYIMGGTDPLEAAPGTIRGDYATNMTMNLVHGSDTSEAAEREIAIFFPDLPE